MNNPSPFLATTANSRFWKKNKKVVFLGKWCLHPQRQSEIDSMDSELMTSPWEDRQAYYAAAKFADQTYENLLKKLSPSLNQIHGVDFELRYWRILAGPWLMCYVNSFYDRFFHIQEALRRYGSFETIGLPKNTHIRTTDFSEQNLFLWDDNYNLLLYSEILQYLEIPYEEQALLPQELNAMTGELLKERQIYFTHSIKGLLRYFRYQLQKNLYRFSDTDGLLTIYRSYLSAQDVMRLTLKSHFKVRVVDFPPTRYLLDKEPEQESPQRHAFLKISGESPFESFLIHLLPKCFPVLYLEGYRQARHRSLRQLSRLPRHLFTGLGFWSNECCKFIAGEITSKGGKISAAQHGGGYGMVRLFPYEEFDKKALDRFYVWGWADVGEEKLKNLPSSKLAKFLKPQQDRIKKGLYPITLITSNSFRYLIRFDTLGKNRDYHRWREQFITSLGSEYQHLLLVRLHSIDCGLGLEQQLSLKFKDIHFDNGIPMLQRLRLTRLAVIDHSTTSLLEVLTYNMPLIAFWDPHYSEVRPEAEPYVQLLRDAGVLFHSPEDAARQVQLVFSHADEWWAQEKIQEARRKFVARFAYTHSDWMDHWIKEIIPSCIGNDA